MASSLIVHNLSSLQSLQYPQRYRTHTLTLTNSHFISSNSVLYLKKQFLFPHLKLKVPTAQKPRSTPLVFAARSNFLKVIQTVWKVGKDGVDAGTTESVPRPIARISVTAAVLIVTLFVLKSFLSTAFFALATMGLVYFVYISLNNDQGPRGGGGGGAKSAEDSLAEARRIMEKYK